MSASLLSRFVAAVLCDVARAQHLSNRYTAKLAEIYRDHELLSALPIPNGRFRELELDAHIGLGEPVRDYPDANDHQLALVGAIDAALPIVAGEALALLARLLKDGPERYRELAAGIERDPMQGYVARQTRTRLLPGSEQYFDPESGHVDLARLGRTLPRAVAEGLRAHRELRAPLAERELGAPLDHALGERGPEWARLVSSGTESMLRLSGEPGLDVQTDTAAVGLLAAGLAASVKLRVELRDYRWVVNVQTGPDGIDVTASRLVPDDR